MASYFIPSIGGTVETGYTSESGKTSPVQVSPLLNTYSPRLFGAPPQLTSYNDMRLLSSTDDSIGSVGDFYLTKILQDAQVANFVIGKALFTGGMASGFGIISMMLKYASAMKRYDIYGSGSGVNGNTTVQKTLSEENMQQAYKKALENDTDVKYKVNDNLADLDDETAVADLSEMQEVADIVEEFSGLVGLGTSLLTSLSVQQPFYTFESDWHSYIENFKMMINTAVIQLGLQNACVKIGDKMLPLGMGNDMPNDKEPWSQYITWINPTGKSTLGSITGLDSLTGDTAQYVSFMIDPAGATESYTNTVGESQIYSTVINQGSEVGAEIAFLTNSTANSIDDAVINIAGGAVSAAEKVLTAMTGGVGRFTAAIAGSMARTFIGNHTIYPQVFKSHSSTQTRDITIHLNASGGDPYSYLTEILVPYFSILAMALPELSKNSAASYSFPPLVQCNIPGIWGTRLGMITSVSCVKNPSGKDVSVNGFPLSMDVTITVTDLQHVLMTSPQNRASTFLNNHTMFDYIAVCAGVDKYRVNGAIRLVSRLALAGNTINNLGTVIGNAGMTDLTSFANKLSGNYLL